LTETFRLVAGLHWGAVFFYALGAILATYGQIFHKDKVSTIAFRLPLAGLLLHTAGIAMWWKAVGHGPYIERFEVLTSNAWVLLVLFLGLVRFAPQFRPASLFVFPGVIFMVAVGLFLKPEIKDLPPTFRSFWLILHITIYKIAFASLVIALVFSIFFLLRRRGKLLSLARLPSLEVIDLQAYRFAGFGFALWASGMLAGSIWAYQSWNVFWNWDPVQTWSLLTWVMFGVYLHMRRFFGLQGEKAAWLFVVCFGLALVSLFLTPLFESSIHAEYFK